jgi:hypothetical protein
MQKTRSLNVECRQSHEERKTKLIIYKQQNNKTTKKQKHRLLKNINTLKAL